MPESETRKAIEVCEMINRRLSLAERLKIGNDTPD
jgi:hypothetical protein